MIAKTGFPVEPHIPLFGGITTRMRKDCIVIQKDITISEISVRSISVMVMG